MNGSRTSSENLGTPIIADDVLEFDNNIAKSNLVSAEYSRYSSAIISFGR